MLFTSFRSTRRSNVSATPLRGAASTRGQPYPVDSFATRGPPRVAFETTEFSERFPRHGGCSVKSLARWATARRKESNLMLSTILIVVLVLMVLGAIPTWPHSRGWGYFPSGLLGIVLLVFLILALTGRV
jgi:Protein of unknown function (DUF3309)